MRVTPLSAAPAPSALRLVGLLIVVAGLFGMHGLATHGVAGVDVVPGTALTSQAMAGSLMRIDVPPDFLDGQKVPVTDRSQSLRSSESGHGGMDMSIVMMCIAILGAALLALLHLLRGERSFSVIWARLRPARVMLHAGRALAPPSLMELSIQRC